MLQGTDSMWVQTVCGYRQYVVLQGTDSMWCCRVRSTRSAQAGRLWQRVRYVEYWRYNVHTAVRVSGACPALHRHDCARPTRLRSTDTTALHRHDCLLRSIYGWSLIALLQPFYEDPPMLYESIMAGRYEVRPCTTPTLAALLTHSQCLSHSYSHYHFALYLLL